MHDFAKAAQSLTKNPLGIIGLFIVLVYGFACLVLGLSASNLIPTERVPLVWFIVLFPILILGVFFRLVTKHHKKLYAPSDYKDERNFFSEPLSDERRTERLKFEVQRVAEEIAISSSSANSQEALISQNTQVTQSNNTIVQNTQSIRSVYADAERLAFLALEQEIGKPFNKYVKVSSHGREEEFDGVLITNEEAHLIEIKYFIRPIFKREFLEAIIHRASTFIFDKALDKEADREKVILWIGIVVDFPKEELPKFKQRIESTVRCNLFMVNIRFFHLDDLKVRYG